MQEFVAQVANANNEKLKSVDESTRMLGLKSRDEKLPGMGVALMRHQLMGVAWYVASYR